MPFVVGKKEFHKEIEKEDYTDPELKFDKPRLQIESFIVESINGNSHYQKNR